MCKTFAFVHHNTVTSRRGDYQWCTYHEAVVATTTEKVISTSVFIKVHSVEIWRPQHQCKALISGVLIKIISGVLIKIVSGVLIILYQWCTYHTYQWCTGVVYHKDVETTREEVMGTTLMISTCHTPPMDFWWRDDQCWLRSRNCYASTNHTMIDEGATNCKATCDIRSAKCYILQLTNVSQCYFTYLWCRGVRHTVLLM